CCWRLAGPLTRVETPPPGASSNSPKMLTGAAGSIGSPASVASAWATASDPADRAAGAAGTGSFQAIRALKREHPQVVTTAMNAAASSVSIKAFRRRVVMAESPVRSSQSAPSGAVTQLHTCAIGRFGDRFEAVRDAKERYAL